MSKKKSKLQQAQDEAQAAINETNKKIEELGKHSNNLCIELNNIQKLFDEIRNIPSEKKIECEKFKKIRLNWKQQAEKIESDYKAVAAGVSAGVAIVASGILFWRSSSKKKRIEEIFALISKRDVKSYKLAVVGCCRRGTCLQL